MSGRPTQPHGSMFAAITSTLSSREPADRQRRVETLLGFVAFFALVMLLRTASATLHGAPSAQDAVLTAVLLGIGYLLLRRWQALDRTVSQAAGRSGRRR